MSSKKSILSMFHKRLASNPNQYLDLQTRIMDHDKFITTQVHDI